MDEKESNPIVISDCITEPYRFQHPKRTDAPPWIPQLVAKNHVTTQQVGNALQALVDNRSMAHEDWKLVTDTVEPNPSTVQCEQCHYVYTNSVVHIVRGGWESSNMAVAFTMRDIHEMTHASSTQKPDPKHVELLGLKPNMCYFQTYKWSLSWNRKPRTTGFTRFPPDPNKLCDGDHMSYGYCGDNCYYRPDPLPRLYEYNENGVRALVSDDEDGNRSLLLQGNACPSGQQIIVEGYVCYTSSFIKVYDLTWSRDAMAQFWFTPC